MPPKFDDNDEVKKKKQEPIIIEGIDILTLTFSKLQELTLQLYEKLLNTREERISLQVERDKLRTFWEITREEIDLCRAKCLLKDNELQEVQIESNKLIKEIEQEVKYIGYEHKQHISNLNKADSAMFSNVENEMTQEKIELLSEKKNLKEKLRNIRSENEEQLSSIRENNLENLSKVKISTQNQLIEVEKGFNNYFKKVIDQLILKHEMEMAEVEERKNGHITELRKIHKQQCQELKGHYNSVTKDDLTVISNLKESIEKLKSKEAEMTSQIQEILNENEHLRKSLLEIQAEVKELKRMLTNYEKDLYCLYTTQITIDKTIDSINNLKFENENIASTVTNMKKSKMSYKTLLQSITNDFNHYPEICDLEDMIQLLNLEFKSKVKILSNTIDANPHKKMEIIEFLEKKCLTVEDLQNELFKVCKAHDDLIKTYETKLTQFGIDKSKLSYKPLLLENIGLGPAGLVTKNL